MTYTPVIYTELQMSEFVESPSHNLVGISLAKKQGYVILQIWNKH